MSLLPKLSTVPLFRYWSQIGLETTWKASRWLEGRLLRHVLGSGYE
jgi:hypothetical protein